MKAWVGKGLKSTAPILFAALVAVMASGCLSKLSTDNVKNETLETSLTTTVPPAPKQAYLKVGQSEQFSYWGHSITINYTSSHPTQLVKVTLDGAEQIFQKELTESPRGIYWRKGNLSFAFKPVVWEVRNGQKIPIYESTWNTTELYFEVFVSMER